MGIYVSTRVTRHTRVSMGPAGWLMVGPLMLCWYLLLFELLLMWWMLKLMGLGAAALCTSVAGVVRRRRGVVRGARVRHPQRVYVGPARRRRT